MRIFFKTFILTVVILFSSPIPDLENCCATDTQQPSSLEKVTKEEMAGQSSFIPEREILEPLLK